MKNLPTVATKRMPQHVSMTDVMTRPAAGLPGRSGAAQGADEALRSLSAWLLEARRRSLHTFRSYSRTSARFLEWLQQSKAVPVADALRHCRPSDVSAWLSLSLNGGKETSAAQRLACLRSMFRALVSDGIVEMNPAREVKLKSGLHREAEHYKVVPSTALIRVLKSIPDTVRGKRDKAMILLMTNNGLRRSEVAGLKISDLKLDDELAAVRIRGKGRRVDLMPLKVGTIKAILDWLELRDGGDDSTSAPVFHCLSKGRHARSLKGIRPEGVYRALKRYFPKHTVHGLRGRCITSTYLNSGRDIHAAQLVARHASSSTTNQVYVQCEKLKAAAVYAPEFE